MKVLGIIPARFASSRFPGKPLIDLKGKTMIQRVYEGVKKSSRIHEVVVATDDMKIFEEVLRFGGNAIMTSENHTTGTDRCGEVAQLYSDFDLIINIQGDEPLVDFRQLDALIDAFDDEKTAIATLGIRDVSLDDINNTNRIKIAINHENKALYFSRSPIPNFANAKGNPLEIYPYMRHIGLYAFRLKTLIELINLKPSLIESIESLEQLRWLYYGYSIQIIETSIETPNIDVPEDVEKVLAFL
ncbi:MAG: 3-deoxy-manno-octulosonate cytidylyltransferase [Flavobacteriia bacterium]|nr:3-deoxy-manno-octulosonate cytidylyltransferase [Flavobacteriia bacterium]